MNHKALYSWWKQKVGLQFGHFTGTERRQERLTVAAVCVCVPMFVTHDSITVITIMILDEVTLFILRGPLPYRFKDSKWAESEELACRHELEQ